MNGWSDMNGDISVICLSNGNTRYIYLRSVLSLIEQSSEGREAMSLWSSELRGVRKWVESMLNEMKQTQWWEASENLARTRTVGASSVQHYYRPTDVLVAPFDRREPTHLSLSHSIFIIILPSNHTSYLVFHHVPWSNGLLRRMRTMIDKRKILNPLIWAPKKTPNIMSNTLSVCSGQVPWNTKSPTKVDWTNMWC